MNRKFYQVARFSFYALVACISTSSSAQNCLYVEGHQKISDTDGNFTGVLDNSDLFGRAIDSIGDLDGDGVVDLIAGAVFDDDNGTDKGAVWILFLNIDGTVKSHQKISATQGNFTGSLSDDDRFGVSVASLGDLNGDMIEDVVVGAYLDDDGGSDKGAVWILFLDTNGMVKSHQKISDTQGNFTGSLTDADIFGVSVACIGDLNNDNIPDIVVGAEWDDDGGTDRGAVWVLFLDTTGMVKSHQKISDTQGNFTGILTNDNDFAVSVTCLGDLNNDGSNDIAVGAFRDDDGGTNKGAVWILYLDTSGLVITHQKISATQGNFTGILDDNDWFGYSVSTIGDLNGDAINDLAVGANQDDDGGTNKGAMWILFLDTNGMVKSHQKISATQGNFTGDLDDADGFGCSITSLGDLDGNGFPDIAVGANKDDDGGTNRGAVWILNLADTCLVADIMEMEKDPQSLATVYPNPSSGEFILIFDNDNAEKFNLQIYTYSGKLVYTIGGVNSNRIAIERGNLPSGLYLYVLKDEIQVRARGKLTLTD